MNNPKKIDPYYNNKGICIPLDAFVTVTTMGNIMQIKHLTTYNPNPSVKKIGKDTFKNMRTGEIINSKKKTAVKRTESPVSLKKTFQRIGQIIQANVSEPEKVRWVTLTYRENMTDTKQLYEDFRRFYGRLKTYCQQHGWDHPEYISVAEPQARGAWHLHIFLIWTSQIAPFIPNKDLARVWRHGYTKIKALKNTDNVAGYLRAYLQDIRAEELPKKLRESKGDLNRDEKRIIKRGRLSFYPSGFNIVRHSKGIKMPEVERTVAVLAFDKVKGSAPTYHCRKKFTLDNGFDTTLQIVEFKRNADGTWDNPDNDDDDWEYDFGSFTYNNHNDEKKD